jgi:hypothetical protein
MVTENDKILKHVDIIFLTFDLTNKESFLNIDNKHIPFLKDYINENTLLYLVGTKSDLVNNVVINNNTALNLLKKLNCLNYFITSSKNNLNFKDIVITAVLGYYNTLIQTPKKNKLVNFTSKSEDNDNTDIIFDKN